MNPTTMTKEAHIAQLQELFPSLELEVQAQWPHLKVPVADWLAVAQRLRQELQLDYLFCLTCIDWKTHLQMVYHLESTLHRQAVVVKVDLDATAPEVESVCHIWRTAEFHEREVYELFGVQFRNHPDLRLLILPDGWEGRHPLRKDFDDPVNMIRL